MAEMKFFQGDLAMALEAQSLTELLAQDIRKLMILEPEESSKAANAKSLALLAAGTNLLYGFASVKPSAVSTSSSSSSQASSFNLLIYEPRIFIRPLERDRPEHQTEKVLCLTEEEKKQLQKRSSRCGGPELRQVLLDDMKSVGQRFLPSKKRHLKLLGKMLAEADDFWPRLEVLEASETEAEVQEILSAVIAFKELTAWYALRPGKSSQGEVWVISEMLQTLAEEIRDRSAMLKPFPYLLRHLRWSLDLLLQDPSWPSPSQGSGAWLRSFEALQGTLPEVDEDSEAEERPKFPKLPKHGKSQGIPGSKALKAPRENGKETEEMEKMEKIAKIPVEKRQTAKGQGGGKGKTCKTQKRKNKAPKGSRKASKDKNKEKDEKTAKGPTEVKSKLDTEKSQTESHEAYLRCLERREEILAYKKKRRREIRERRMKEAEEAANKTNPHEPKPFLFGLCM